MERETWISVSPDEWRRPLGGSVRVARLDSRWKVINASWRDVLGIDENVRTCPDAETGRRQCDWGALQPDVLPIYGD